MRRRTRGGCLGTLPLLLLLASIPFLVCEGAAHLFQPRDLLVQGKFHPRLGWLYAPGSRALLRTEAGWLSHRANADGFLDRNHVSETHRKPAENRFRIAFFGDEQVEGLDIPGGGRFFELLPDSWSRYGLEYFGCGISGWGTFTCGLAWRELTEKYTFQQVIYVFSEDDFGDNFRGSSRRLYVPQAIETDQPPGFQVDPRSDSLIQKRIGSRSGWVTVLKARSMFFWRMLEFFDVQTERNEYISDYKLRDSRGTHWPAPVSPPVAWPVETQNRAGDMMNRLLATWSQTVKQGGAGFTILTLPASEDQLLGTAGADSSWQGWLRTIARQENIEVIDGVRALTREARAGRKVMQGRRLTAGGHQALAETLKFWLEKKFLDAGLE